MTEEESFDSSFIAATDDATSGAERHDARGDEKEKRTAEYTLSEGAPVIGTVGRLRGGHKCRTPSRLTAGGSVRLRSVMKYYAYSNMWFLSPFGLFIFALKSAAHIFF